MGGVVEERLVRERDLLLEVLRLLSADEPLVHLRKVLEGLAELCGAERAFLEVFAEPSASQRRCSLAHRCSASEEEEIRAATSRGIVAAALASGKTVHTPYALLDPRFASSGSVRAQRLEAVLCVPIPAREPGVLYLEGRRGAGPFTPETIGLAETVAGFLGSALQRAVPRAPEVGDPTAPHRARLRLEEIVGRSARLAAVFDQLALAAPLDVTVLITGDSGTGKTQLARAIHENSPRRAGPFLELNCAAIPEGLIESELFGTLPGAFPGARRAEGKVRAAEGGTLFLDEIAEIPLSAQGKLLQLLQSKQYYALAGTEIAKANIRLIAATNIDLGEAVTAKRFREDLFYRLSVLSIRMPNLAERREDIEPLVRELLARGAEQHSLPALPPSPGLLAECESTEWPGNVRQLRHQLETALIRAAAERASQVEARHLRPGDPDEKEAPETFHGATRKFQRELVRRELEASGWNVSEVARRLDLTRSHLYNLIKAFELTRNSQ